MYAWAPRTLDDDKASTLKILRSWLSSLLKKKNHIINLCDARLPPRTGLIHFLDGTIPHFLPNQLIVYTCFKLERGSQDSLAWKFTCQTFFGGSYDRKICFTAKCRNHLTRLYHVLYRVLTVSRWSNATDCWLDVYSTLCNGRHMCCLNGLRLHTRNTPLTGLLKWDNSKIVMRSTFSQEYACKINVINWIMFLVVFNTLNM